jgi:hypothetical protein
MKKLEDCSRHVRKVDDHFVVVPGSENEQDEIIIRMFGERIPDGFVHRMLDGNYYVFDECKSIYDIYNYGISDDLYSIYTDNNDSTQTLIVEFFVECNCEDGCYNVTYEILDYDEEVELYNQNKLNFGVL